MNIGQVRAAYEAPRPRPRKREEVKPQPAVEVAEVTAADEREMVATGR